MITPICKIYKLERLNVESNNYTIRIAQNSGGGKHMEIWQIKSIWPMFYPSKSIF